MSDPRVVTRLYETLANLPEGERNKIFIVAQSIANGREIAKQRTDRNRNRTEAYMKEVRHNLVDLETAVALKACRTKYFHFRTQLDTDVKKLGVTTCLILGNDDNSIVSRGVTIVSWFDNPSKAEGRLRALRRAYDAADGGETDCPIRREEPITVLEKCIAGFRQDQPEWLFKSNYMPEVDELSTIEKEWYLAMIAKPRVQQVQTA